MQMLAVFVAAELTLVGVTVLVLLPYALGDPAALERGLPPWALIAALVVPTSAAALVGVAGTALLGGGPRAGRVRRELGIAWRWRDVGIGAALGAGGLVLTLPAAALWSAWVGEDAGSAVGDAFEGRQLDPAMALAAFLVVWLIAPLAEEVLFRGVLWRALEHWRWNRWVVFAVTTVVFSLAHLEFQRAPLLVVLAIPIGLARMVTGNLVAAVVSHQVNNFLPALALLLATTGVLPLP